MNKGDIMSNIRIEKQDYFGNGVAKLENKTVFIKKALKDELVKIELTEEKKHFSKARITEIIEKSPMRQEAECLYYQQCGGCHLLHQDYHQQLEFKVNKVQEILKRIAHLNVDLTLADIIFKNKYHYRNKIVLHNLGLYKEKSNNSVKINECLLVNNQINNLISILSKSKIVPKEVMIRVTSLKESLVVIDGKISEDVKKELLTIVDVLEYNNQYLTKKHFIMEQIDNYRFKISPKSFFQVNYEVMKKMYQYIVELVKELKPVKALDLYCGTGTIGILISKYVSFVEGIEVIEDAIVDANYNKEQNEVTNINFICSKVENVIDSFKAIDLIIVDPPRSGLDNKTKDYLKIISPKKIIYVSCDIATLARDISDLSTSYNFEKIKVFDMFPNTYHVECICVLSLR